MDEPEIKEKPIKSEILSKDLLKSYLEFISNLTFSKDEEAEKISRYILECLEQLSNSGFFSQSEYDETEYYFITSFSPLLIKKLSNESVTNKVVKENFWKIIKLYCLQLAKNFDNMKYQELAEALTDFFHEDKIFLRSYQEDAADKYLELKYNEFYPGAKEWRKTLSSGSLIDCLQKDMEMNLNIDRIGVAGWTRGSVISVENKIVKFRFCGTGEVKTLPIFSCQILPFKTLSKDYDWRESLKSGDEIDYLDSKSWYRCTIVDAFNRYSEGKPSKFVVVGLRIFRENGKCRDNRGRNYFGWSENFDKEVCAHDPRIRMPQKFSKKIENYDLISSYPIESRKFNDLETFIPFQINSVTNYVIPRKPTDFKRQDIEYYNSVNYFVEVGGFEVFLNMLRTPINLSYDYFSIIMEFVINVHEFLHHEYAKVFLKEFLRLVMDYLIYFASSDIKTYRRDHLESVLKKIKDVSYKVYMENDVNAKYDIFMVDFGLGCISSTTLQKKMIGIKYLSSSLLEAVRVNLGHMFTSSYNEKRLHSSILIDRIKDKNIIEYIFGGSSHIQLIQLSFDLVKSLLITNTLTKNDLTKIYELTYSNDIETKNAIYKILQSNYNHFSNELASFLITTILKKPSEKTNSNDLQLIGEVYKSMNTSKQMEIVRIIVDNFKLKIFNGTINTQINDTLIIELIQFLKCFEMRDHRVNFIQGLLKELREKKDVKSF